MKGILRTLILGPITQVLKNGIFLCLGQFLRCRIGGSKRAFYFRSKTKSCILTQSKKCLFDPNFFDRAIRSAHPIEKVDFFNGMRGSDGSIEKHFEAHRISHHPTKHTNTPYNSSDAGLTAIVLLLLLLLLLPTTTPRATSCSPPASSAYRHPMAAVRVIDDLFATPLLQQLLLCSLR